MLHSADSQGCPHLQTDRFDSVHLWYSRQVAVQEGVDEFAQLRLPFKAHVVFREGEPPMMLSLACVRQVTKAGEDVLHMGCLLTFVIESFADALSGPHISARIITLWSQEALVCRELVVPSFRDMPDLKAERKVFYWSVFVKS